MSNSYSVGGNRLHQQPPPQSPKVQPLAGAGAGVGAGVGVVGGGNQGQSSKILELLDALKHEIEIIHEEASFSKYHRKDLEGKCKRNGLEDSTSDWIGFAIIHYSALLIFIYASFNIINPA